MRNFLITMATIFGICNSAKANGTDPFAALLIEVNNRTVFNQTTSSDKCPKAIGLIETTGKFNSVAKKGDREIYLAGYDQERSSFAFEGNTLFYRPNLAQGKTNIISRKVDFPMGIAYSVAKQTVANGILTTEYTAKIGSVAMIAAVNRRLQYDSNLNTIKYHFSGNGVEDVDCTYIKGSETHNISF